MSATFLLAAWTALQPSCHAAASPADEPIARAAFAVLRFRDGLARVNAFAREREDLFPRAKLQDKRLLGPLEREAARNAWKALLDYVVALDAVGRKHHRFWGLGGDRRRRSFLVASAAYLSGYRHALDFLDLAENDPGLHALFDEGAEELGLGPGAYLRFKTRFLNVARAAEFAALRAQLKAQATEPLPELRAAIEDDSKRIWEHGQGRGEELTAANGLKLLKTAAFTAWFPVQAEVSEWMGDTKVRRKGLSLVSPEQLRGLQPRLEPGDVLLERREWYLSNVGLPGYWPHAAIYIGTPEERRRYFDEPEIKAWASRQGAEDFERLLAKQAPKAHALAGGSDHDGPHRVLEAISEGVSFTSLEHSASADAVAVLRPRRPKAEKAQALARAFRYHGRPYDFNFDFGTDSAIVCTELVYKAYEPAEGFTGLKLPLETLVGRLAVPANRIARLFDEEFGSPQAQFELVAFLDGSEKTGKAEEAGADAFRASWKRPKWHILLK